MSAPISHSCGASIAASLALLGEEPLERFLRLALAALVATAFLVEMFSVTGCVATTAFRNLRAAVVAMGFVARGSTDTPLASINGFITDAWNLVIKSAKRLSLDLSVGIIVSKCFKCFVRITCAACEDASLA
ncbi:hypothetical protein MRX96_042133 [Rhipicephalus microplus]